MDDFPQKYALIQHEERCRNFTESNKATIEFSKIALRGAFVLNGAAAVAVLYSQKIALADALSMASYFALGALLAAIGSGVTYLAQFYIMKTWERCLYERPTLMEMDASILDHMQSLAAKTGVFFRTAALLGILGAYVCFCCGALHGYKLIETSAQKQKVQQEAPRCPHVEEI